jgi:hypothetical protein
VTPDRWQRAQEIFASAVTRSAESRAGYLDGACGNDVELRREVESLLASHDSASTGFLEQPAIGMGSMAPPFSGRKPLSRGSRLGSFEIVSPLGAGGMGEVYRARDPRLGRDVAIKVLPLEVASDRERLKRFEKEARSASALNHPNIVTIYETGTSDGLPWIAMEHVEGETLRTQLAAGPLQTKRLLNVAVQIAEGLARAHEAGIVHRDLKPENVMVTKDGLVKILDFGLAKLQGPVSGGSDKESQLPTVTGTSPGIVLGTVGYMSPEQASGKVVDFRSDQFSFGSILYEMVTGKRAFQKKTAVETLTAILNEEPEPIAHVAPQTPAPLRWTVERCLAKEPRQRYSATDDLAREMAGVRDHLSEASSSALTAAPVRRSWVPKALAALGIAALLGAVYVAAFLRSHVAPALRFQKITFQQGAAWRGRFAPDGQTIVYAMISIGDDMRPVELFSTRAGSLDARSLGLPPADVLAISSAGELALGLAKDPLSQEVATLAQTSMTGGIPREILENVWGADWSPDGKDLAVVHIVGGRQRLEYPIGKVLYESEKSLDGPRVSPDGERVAFTEWREWGTLKVVDRKGVVRTVKENVGGTPACWSIRGDELWWIKAPNVASVQASEIHAITMTGRERVVAAMPGEYALLDLSRDGRVLVEHVSKSYTMLGTFPGEAKERKLDWLDQSIPANLSPDGKLLLFNDRNDAAGSALGAYLRRTDGSPAVRLGEGSPCDFSPDGKWTLVCRKLPKHFLVLVPIGAGQERVLPSGAPIPNHFVLFHPDGKRVFFDGVEPGHGERIYEENIETGAERPLSPEGMSLFLISPDGSLLMVRAEGAKEVTLLPVDHGAGAAPRTVALQSEREMPIHWSADGRSILTIVDPSNTRPFRVDRLDLASGHRTLWHTFSPPGALGAGGFNLVLNRNEDAWVAGYSRYFSDLLVIDGLK